MHDHPGFQRNVAADYEQLKELFVPLAVEYRTTLLIGPRFFRKKNPFEAILTQEQLIVLRC
jgi:hypothetical protein